jgi:RND family efflux transporter MFP subunit
MKKITIIVIVIILAIIVATQVSAIKNIGQKPKTYSEKTKVKKDNIKALISASGKIQSNTIVTLKFQTSGLLTYVGVKKDDFVKKGQLIASLDRRELEKTLKKKLNSYMSERWDFEEDKNVTYKDVALNDTIKRTLEKNGFDLGTSVLDVEVADIALKFANLYSPIDGIVTAIDAPREGVNVTAATATFTVADYNDIAFKIDVDEVDIGKVKIGQMVDIKLDAYEGQKFMGVVDKIGFTSTTTTSGGTAFPVEVRFPDNTDLRFKIGMNGDADIITDIINNTLVIPVDYTFENDAGQKYVNMLDKNDQIKRQTIKIGIETEDMMEILSGVKVNDVVVIPNTD